MLGYYINKKETCFILPVRSSFLIFTFEEFLEGFEESFEDFFEDFEDFEDFFEDFEKSFED